MFKAFDKAEIGTTVSIVEMPYDETTELNESNFTLFLQKLEEMISTVITYMSARKGDNNAAVSSIGFERLPVKTFEKKNVKEKLQGYDNKRNIEATNWQSSNEIYEKDFSGSMMPSNAETEADFSEFDAYEVTDMNQLRKRFHEMIAHSQEALEESVGENKY